MDIKEKDIKTLEIHRIPLRLMMPELWTNLCRHILFYSALLFVFLLIKQENIAIKQFSTYKTKTTITINFVSIWKS
jgi:hypothetical protein